MKVIPIYNFYKHKYGQKVLIDVIDIDKMKADIKKTPVYITTFYSIIIFTEGEECIEINERQVKVKPDVVVCSRPGEMWKWNPETKLNHRIARQRRANNPSRHQRAAIGSLFCVLGSLFPYRTDLAQKIFTERENVKIMLDESLTMQSLIAAGTSAGGRQPKAIIAINPKTGEIRSGQIAGQKGFKYCILKFGDPSRSSAELEMAYYKMATLVETYG